MPTIYVKLSGESSAYLDQLAAASRESKSTVLDLIVTAARVQGWVIRPGNEPAIYAPPAGTGRTSPAAGPGDDTAEAGR
jgi:hypothetical protein